ncbi:hypothetical protein CYLTODRAFT_454856 [Cylindrobasidium torrendii FP15055 ss-10]|uniref:Uncharacterized protein n=1 Tax=Cylindrobasidium torrendii FP15055 ss-10 TaxID=1314674 RepID=A0A0D7B9Q0_9AGAR|nr:hypothetical protein CYLTODRAFT_454856 [Cylindrobasidium torrendii FP15055 ss-10]
MPLKFPMLEEVYIETVDEEVDPGEPSGFERSWFKDAPRLKRVKLEFARQWPYAWYPSSLTHMSILLEGNMCLLQYAALSFPDLQELEIQGEDFFGPPSPPELQPICSNALKYLTCTGLSLKYLTFPALECLAVRYLKDYSDHEYYQGISWLDILADFIRRSKCRLTDLHLDAECSVLQDPRMYTEILPLVAPTLVVLELAHLRYSETEKIVHSLTRTASSPGSLPYLEYLEISSIYLQENDIDDGADSFVRTLATALVSLRNETLAKQWHASLLKQVFVPPENDPCVVKMRKDCLNSLCSRGLEVIYAPYRARRAQKDVDEPTSTCWLEDWHRVWYNNSGR